jgi:hypothetical protein
LVEFFTHIWYLLAPKVLFGGVVLPKYGNNGTKGCTKIGAWVARKKGLPRM